jgi:hypothetical protein
MLVTTLRPAPTDPATVQAEGLRLRAQSLRHQAEHLEPVLATTYRRRASELELEAFIVGLQAIDADESIDGALAC